MPPALILELQEITLASAPSLLPRLDAENERILEQLRARSHEWCAREEGVQFYTTRDGYKCWV